MALTEDEAKELAELEAKFGGAQSHADLGSKVFSQDAITNAERQASGIPSAIRSSIQNMAQGAVMAGPELAAGVVRLGSPDTADYMERGLTRFRRAMAEGSNKFYTGNENDGISEDASKTMYSIGNTIPLGVGMAGAASLPGVIGQSAVIGGLGGLQAAGEGDSRLQTVAKTGLGSALGAGTGAVAGLVPMAVRKAKDIVVSKLGLDKLAEKKALEQATLNAAKVHAAIRKDVNDIYKEIGIPKTKMSTEDYVKQSEFLNQFKYDMSTKASGKFDAALSVQAPDSVKAAFNDLPKEVKSMALERLNKSGDILDVKALNNPDSALFYEQARKAIASTKTPGNAGLSKDFVRLFSNEIPGYKEAMAENMASKSFNKKLGENFFNAVKSNQYDKIVPQIDNVLQTAKGPEVLHNVFVDGMRKDLIRNSNLTPLEQLTKTIGADPLQQSQVVDYMTRIGKKETADKLQALAGFVNATKQAQSQPNSTVGRMVGMKSSELDPTKMADAIGNLLNSKSKFSPELVKIMQEQVPSATRTEKFFNLLRRAGKYGPKMADITESTLEGVKITGRAGAQAIKAAPARLILDTQDQQDNNTGY